MVKFLGFVELFLVVFIVVIVLFYFLRLCLGIVVILLVLLYNYNGYVDLSKEYGLLSCGFLDFKYGREFNFVLDLRFVLCLFVKFFVMFVLFFCIYEVYFCFLLGIFMIVEYRFFGFCVVYLFSINIIFFILSFLFKLNLVV